jgi:hypothetical protein
LDTGIPKYPIKSLTPIGGITTFTGEDIYFFLKYNIDEVKAVAPEGANAYAIAGDVSLGKMVVPVQFFKVEIDFSKRLLTPEELYDNPSLLLQVNGI